MGVSNSPDAGAVAEGAALGDAFADEAYMKGLSDELGDRGFECPAALVGVAAISVGFFLLAVRRLQEMDVP